MDLRNLPRDTISEISRYTTGRGFQALRPSLDIRQSQFVEMDYQRCKELEDEFLRETGVDMAEYLGHVKWNKKRIIDIVDEAVQAYKDETRFQIQHIDPGFYDYFIQLLKFQNEMEMIRSVIYTFVGVIFDKYLEENQTNLSVSDLTRVIESSKREIYREFHQNLRDFEFYFPETDKVKEYSLTGFTF